jgi:phospholipid/cholesterol/gamma-HCH transport system substrate-binding protein
MMISDEYQIPGNLKVLVRSKGFLGEKYAELKLKEPVGRGSLASGDTITESSEITDFDQLGNKIGDIADDVKAITSSLKEVLATEQARDNMTTTLTNVREITDTVNVLVQQNELRINSIIKNMEVLTAKLSDITVANASNINNIVDNINSITNDLRQQTPLISENLRVVTNSLKQDGPAIASNLRNITTDVDDVMSSQKDNLKNTIQNMSVVTAKLEKTVDNLNDITGKIKDGKGTIGKLVNEEETVDNLNGALSGLKDTLGKLNDFKVDLSFYAERFGDVDESKGHARIKITPSRKRYYLLGLSSHPDGIVKETRTEYSRDYTDASAETDYAYTSVEKERNPGAMTFTVQYAHRFWEKFFFRVGMMESEAGIGLDYHPFENEDKFVLSADVYDFPREDEDREAHTKFGAKYNFYKNLFITAGYDDVLNSETDSWFVGAGVQFRDDDLKYLLGKVPMPIN